MITLPRTHRLPAEAPSRCPVRLRPLLLGSAVLLAAGLTACSSPPMRVEQTAGRPVQSSKTFRACVGSYHATQLTGDYAQYARLEQFINQMVDTHGFEREYLLGLFSQAKRKNWTLNYLAKSDQGLKGRPAAGGWSRYRAKFLDERHIGAGVDFARRHRAALQRATRQYGVPQEYILGILAVETTFGGFVGNHRVLDALTTLGFDYARRGDYFRGELESYLLMAREEGIDPARPVGSFAGAMGLGQFMPSSFRKWAVDFNGDGRRDLWNAEDAIGSVANYFAQHGWQAGQPVATPLRTNGSISLEPGLDNSYSLSSLQQAGLQPVGAGSCEGELRLLLLRHQGHDQYLIGHPNFYTITRYNHSTYYAMAVHELAQEISRRL
ncbi:lytic murein transglycosylase B [Desulfobulbus propionicus DSM 2032]|uniref:Lytic murein transglycosylase B n=1 Tax=Desulfobulbus propionicus (strain ATCC 33891 / DSM 2032 / VKM B-1956 / 1pr3) TaxID=577650 RepID=A0A7U4DMN9_DESPD|nr:lytic murein transglycosylase B [Desulfobulbus propionicus]ADW16252.1 lytic murein transglycosylase B [Desulfobulbus propionicus DSM 2032]